MTSKRKVDVFLLGKTANGRLLSKTITHALYVEQLEAAHQTEVVRYLSGYSNKLRREIADTLRFYERIFGSIEPQHWTNIKRTLVPHFKEYSSGFTRTGEFSLRKVTEFADREVTWQGNAIQGVLPTGIELPFARPDPGNVRELIYKTPMRKRPLPEQWRGLGKTASIRVNNAVKRGVIEGKQHREIAKDVFDAIKKNKNHAKTLARTAHKHAMVSARLATIEANSDVMRGWQFVAVLDSRTTPTCMDLDGEVFPVGQGYADAPPLHFNCRSDVVDVLKSWKELGLNVKDTTKEQRAALGGPVSGTINYKDWIRVQPLKTKQLAFGKDVGLKIHKGRMSVESAIKAMKPTGSFTYGKAGAVKKYL
jgi:SPP1 gp7 family putative phage head morphogenesis protein